MDEQVLTRNSHVRGTDHRFITAKTSTGFFNWRFLGVSQDENIYFINSDMDLLIMWTRFYNRYDMGNAVYNASKK